MHLTNLSLLNFKNCQDLSFVFSNRVNCFLGKNGQGKTNILDAIHYMSYTKSFFNSIDSQNILFDAPFLAIQASCQLNEEIVELHCGMKRGDKKVFRKNKKAYKKLSEHIGFMPVVMITPYDINLVLDGSEVRRRFIDALISQFERPYLEHLIFYNRLLLQRNKLLKKWANSNSFQPDLLEVIDMQLVEKGNIIYKSRKTFLIDFIPTFNNYYQKLSNSKEKVELFYDSTLNNNDFASLLKDSIGKDRQITHTSVGIHRDDLLFKIHGQPLKKYGSQGQQKSFLIALKLAKFQFIKNQKDFPPILLLDDIFDKLDSERVSYLLDLIENEDLGQTFITDTDLEKVPNILNSMKIAFKAFEINNGFAVQL
jgi:DNA replication and repair protein RecF